MLRPGTLPPRNCEPFSEGGRPTRIDGANRCNYLRRILGQNETHFNIRARQAPHIYDLRDGAAVNNNARQARYRHRIVRLSLMASPCRAAVVFVCCTSADWRQAQACSMIEQACEFCMKMRPASIQLCRKRCNCCPGPKGGSLRAV